MTGSTAPTARPPQIEVVTCETMPQLLLRNAERYGNQTALRWKRFGVWSEITWAEYLVKVRDLALGLVELGLQPDDRVALVGDNRPDWVYGSVAAQAMHAWSVGLYQDSLADEFAHIINHAEPEIAIAQDQEQVDKLLDLGERIPSLKHIIYCDRKGLESYDDPRLHSIQSLMDFGKRTGSAGVESFNRSISEGRSEQVAGVFYTSGTTGEPKGAMLTHGNLMRMAEGLTEFDPLEPNDDFVSFLPMGWVGEQMMALATALLVPMVVNFPEEPETVGTDLREIGPRVMFSPPRVWENNLSSFQVGVEEAQWPKRLAARWSMRVAHRVVERRNDGKRIGLGLRAARWFAEVAVLRQVKNSMGLTRLRRAYTGGAALGPEVFTFFQALGVNLKQVYGQTECAGVGVVHRDGKVRPDTVGEPLPGVEIRISNEEEVLVGGSTVFKGYFRDEQATSSAVSDGWLHTGDAGMFTPDGQLSIIDRVKDLMSLADGTRFSPQFIENKLKFSQYVREAVVFGRERAVVTAFINIDAANVGNWAERKKIPYTTYADLSQRDEVILLILEEVRRVNQDLPLETRLHRFVILHKELDADDDELTRTRKIRRGFVEKRYEGLIEALYSDEPHYDILTNVRYSDGTEAEIATQLRLLDAPLAKG